MPPKKETKSKAPSKTKTKTAKSAPKAGTKKGDSLIIKQYKSDKIGTSFTRSCNYIDKILDDKKTPYVGITSDLEKRVGSSSKKTEHTFFKATALMSHTKVTSLKNKLVTKYGSKLKNIRAAGGREAKEEDKYYLFISC